MKGHCGICGDSGHNRTRCKLFFDYSLRFHVRQFLNTMDQDIMKGPSTEERGKKIAAACNLLDMSLQRAEHFGVKMGKGGRG